MSKILITACALDACKCYKQLILIALIEQLEKLIPVFIQAEVLGYKDCIVRKH